MLALALAAAAVAFTFADPRISESSGLAAGSAPGIVFTHNDSGDSARFFAVGEDGRTRTTYDLPGVQARDWEDMARGPDEQGRSSLWLGDIGDNNSLREQGILVHRVGEPELTGEERVTTEPPTSFRLVYPDGPGDAEGLMVHPATGRLYVVSKPLGGAARVYAAPGRLDPDGRNVLEQVGSIEAQVTGTPGGPGIGGLAQLLVTAADISPDGARLAVRTYTDLYVWDLPTPDVGAALEADPVVTPLPESRQGEGLTWTSDSSAVLVSSEGEGAAVHRVVPQQPSSAPEAELQTEPSPVDRVAEPESDRWPLVLAGGALFAALLVVRGAVRGRRYRRR